MSPFLIIYLQGKNNVKLKFKKKIYVKQMKLISMKNILSFLILILLISCITKSDVEKEIEKIPVDIEILRFDKVFGTANVSELPELKRKYPSFFPKRYHDSIWIQKMQDTLQKQLYDEVIKIYPSDEKIKDNLEFLFQHIEYYFPQISTPLVVTATSDVDYRNKIILSDSLLIIGLDTYLGSDHFFYEGIPKYVSQNMKETQIVSDVSSVYAQKLVPRPRQRTFLSQMIYYGKILYLKELCITSASDSRNIGFTNDEFLWVKDNEVEIWRNFVENEFLFSTNTKLATRFINPAPFSKFYLEIDNDSPGMVGRYIGWKIVRSYMEHNSVTLQEMLTQNADEIFNKSKYKPKK